MLTFLSRNYFGFLVLLFFILFIDSWVLQSSFEAVVSQQAAIKNAYVEVDRISELTVKLRDAELSARRFLLTSAVSRFDLSNQFNNVVQQATLTSVDYPSDSAEKEIIEKFATALSGQLDDLLNASDRSGQSTLPIKGVIKNDETYLALASMLSKIKELEESKLKSKTDPAGRYRDIFYLASIITALFNLIVGLFAYRLLVTNRKRFEVDRGLSIEKAEENRIASRAASVVNGQTTVIECAASIVELLIQEFRALDVRVFIISEGHFRNVSDSSGQSGSEKIFELSLMLNALRFKKPSVISDIPNAYWTVSSAFGSSKPNQLIFCPLFFEHEAVGVIEIAAFESSNETQLRRLERLSTTFAVSIHAALAKEQTALLLNKTLRQAEELQSQQEELRTTNEELEQQARALEVQQQELTEQNGELEKTKTELSKKAFDLEKSNRYKTDFLAKMSHELRTPLNSLLILSTLLAENKEKNLTVQQIHFANSMNLAGNDLLTLINDILDLSKIEASKLVLHPTQFSVGEVFASKKRTFEPLATAKEIKLLFEVEPRVSDLILYIDRQRLDQILRNLMSNAIKFTELGSVTLSAKLNLETNFISFIVSDTGTGISVSKQKLIFEAFEQSDASISSRFGGTGLGLSISKELATLLGGTISLESELGSGSKFELSIPISAGIEAVNSEKGTWSLEQSTSSLLESSKSSPTLYRSREVDEKLSSLATLDKSAKSILIVEDDDNFRSIVANSVREYGFEPIEANDGILAMKLLERFTPDAILLDIKLPGISGLGILEVLKRSSALRHIPVHMISGLQFQTNALRMGAFGYLSKPVTVEKINSALGRIENLLSKKLKRLLLIEDNAIQSEAVSALIASADIEVVIAKTGREGLLSVEKGEFDCIVLDLSLPDVSGFDFLKELRNLAISLPPIVIYTGKDLTREEHAYLEEHSESIVIKGARSPERLLDEVSLFLHRVETKDMGGARSLITISDSNEEPFAGRTVLVVDDDIRNIFALTSSLEAKGFTVETARDGIEALESLARHSSIEIVLMDLMMPRMDGLEAIRRIRRNENIRVKKLPVIVLTAKTMRESNEECMEAGANDYLAKPIVMENLITVMKVWLPEVTHV